MASETGSAVEPGVASEAPVEIVETPASEAGGAVEPGMASAPRVEVNAEEVLPLPLPHPLPKVLVFETEGEESPKTMAAAPPSLDTGRQQAEEKEAAPVDLAMVATERVPGRRRRVLRGIVSRLFGRRCLLCTEPAPAEPQEGGD